MDKKTEAYQLGKIAENLVMNEYLKKGYAVLEKRWQLGKNEIDLILQKENMIVLVEVKARSGKDGDPMDAVTPDKRRRMVRSADAYIRTLKGDFDYRFDIATLTGNLESYELQIIEDAFLAADLF